MLDTVRDKILNVLRIYDSYTEIVNEVDGVIDEANEELQERYPNYLILRYTSYIYLTLMEGDLPLRHIDVTYDIIDNLNNSQKIKHKLFYLIEKGLV